VWRVDSVSAFTWFLFLLPLTVALVSTAIARSRRWSHVLAFESANTASAFIWDFHRVYVAQPQSLDPKFQHAPSALFEIALAVDGIVGAIGLLVFTVSLVWLGSTMHPRGARAVFISALFGIAYAIVPGAADALGWRLPVALFWTWALTFPIAAARTAVRSGSPRIPSRESH